LRAIHSPSSANSGRKRQRQRLPLSTHQLLDVELQCIDIAMDHVFQTDHDRAGRLDVFILANDDI
jgi:hypothetical protein